MQSKSKPAEWAKQRVCDLANREPTAPEGTHWRPENIGPGGLASAFARYIEEHEEPPVDPLGAALAHANSILKGEGYGTYDEALDAIRDILHALTTKEPSHD